MERQFTFIGVTTGTSSIMHIFPRWRDALGLGPDVSIVGWDLPIGAPAQRYREAVRTLKDDPHNLGGLVTTHKIDLYCAARDLFDGIDRYAQLCGEVSCLAKRDGRLLGWAKDPISSGKTLHRMLGDRYFARSGGEALIFGAGGAGVAITLYLLSSPEETDRPARIVVTDRSAERLASLQELHEGLGAPARVECVHTADPALNDRLLADLAPGSLVVNATGMGKDTPGSPLSAAALFPERGVIWELNYRGELLFLHQARCQAAERALRVEDGWWYFIFGWTAVIEEVFQRPISEHEVDELELLAAFARPALV
ncbi:MAG TPA: shikimate dehydrogenase [Chloroflexota bacterium]|nr:shikimate dehydrogenase [Chloroflexota bacterium]